MPTLNLDRKRICHQPPRRSANTHPDARPRPDPLERKMNHSVQEISSLKAITSSPSKHSSLTMLVKSNASTLIHRIIQATKIGFTTIMSTVQLFRDGSAKLLANLSEDLSRHDKWLCMMYPRLCLLHQLLREDGVIFISIDDNEVHHLRMLMDEIFGEKNFFAILTRRAMHTVRNSSKDFNHNADTTPWFMLKRNLGLAKTKVGIFGTLLINQRNILMTTMMVEVSINLIHSVHETITPHTRSPLKMELCGLPLRDVIQVIRKIHYVAWNAKVALIFLGTNRGQNAISLRYKKDNHQTYSSHQKSTVYYPKICSSGGDKVFVA